MCVLLENVAEKGGSADLEMKKFFGRFTLDVIATCAFGVQCDSLKDEEAEFVKIAARFNEISLPNRIMIFAIILFVPQLARFVPLQFMNHKVSYRRQYNHVGVFVNFRITHNNNFSLFTRL